MALTKQFSRKLDQLWKRRTAEFRALVVPGLEFQARLETPGLRRADFHRVAVAYGLSFTVDSIGRFTPPSEVEPELRWWLVEFEDHRVGND